MSVIRMIKMFGWERKMNEKISQKREEELVWVWKGAVRNHHSFVNRKNLEVHTHCAQSTQILALLVSVVK